MEWLNEPAVWQADDGQITLTTEGKTDYWQKTFYGFEHDNGHFYYQTVAGDFTAEVEARAGYRSLYDQAGMMIRFSTDTWLKVGVEFVHGRCMLGCVLTRGTSDWAIGPRIEPTQPVRIRLHRKADAVCVQWAPEDRAVPFETLRLGSLGETGEAMVGPMACSPTEGGLEVAFTGFRVLPLADFDGQV